MYFKNQSGLKNRMIEQVTFRLYSVIDYAKVLFIYDSDSEIN